MSVKDDGVCAEAQAAIDGKVVAKMILDFYATFNNTYTYDTMSSSLCAVGPLQSMIGLAIYNGYLSLPSPPKAGG